MRHALQALVEALFRVVFSYDCRGEENVPATGPAVVASNHPSYLDPILLSLEVERPIHFMAWDALFRVPLLGALMRLMGAFPVDVRKGKGREAYERAKALIQDGEIIGIFPEGKRSRTGWMEPALREGAARLAWETGRLTDMQDLTNQLEAVADQLPADATQARALASIAQSAMLRDETDEAVAWADRAIATDNAGPVGPALPTSASAAVCIMCCRAITSRARNRRRSSWWRSWGNAGLQPGTNLRSRSRRIVPLASRLYSPTMPPIKSVSQRRPRPCIRKRPSPAIWGASGYRAAWIVSTVMRMAGWRSSTTRAAD